MVPHVLVTETSRPHTDLNPPIRQVGTARFELQRNWTYAWEEQGVQFHASVPAGFRFRPSTPRLLWPVVSPLDTLTASLLHDYLYREKPRYGPGDQYGFDRQQADALFYQVMRKQGRPAWRAWLAWTGVRLGGWWYWYELDEAV